MFIQDDKEENGHRLSQATSHTSLGMHQPKVSYSAKGAEVLYGLR